MSLILNAAPITFSNAKIQVEKFIYSEDKFEQLRDEFRKSHLIKRSGNEIIAVPFKNGNPPIGGEQATIDLEVDLSLAKSLANNALYRELYRRDCWISSINPLSYLTRYSAEGDHVIPWQTEHVFSWRTSTANAVSAFQS